MLSINSMKPTMIICFSAFMVSQKYFVIDERGDVYNGTLPSIEDYDLILTIADKYSIENIKVTGGSKVILNKYKDRLKSKQIEKYGLKKINVEIIE